MRVPEPGHGTVRRGKAAKAISLVCAGLAAALWLGLRVAGLGQSLWFDEVWRTRVKLDGSSAAGVMLYDIHGPLYNAAMWCWIRIFGDGEVSIRLPSLLLGAVLIAAVYGWTRSRLGRAPALMAAAYLVLSPVHVWFSTEAKNTMLVVTLATLHLMLMQDAISRRRWGRGIAAGVLGAAGIWTSFQAVLVVLPAWVYLLAWGYRRDIEADAGFGREGPWLLSAGFWSVWVCLLLSVPLAIFKLSHAELLYRDYLSAFKWFEPARLLLVWFGTGDALPVMRGAWEERAIIPGIILGPVFVLGVARLARPGLGRLAVIGILGPVLMMLGLELLRGAFDKSLKFHQPRNMVVMLPWLAIAVGQGVACVPAGWRRGLAAALVSGLLLVSSVSMRSGCADEVTVMYPNPDWRGAARWMEASAGSERLNVASRTPLLPMAYYTPSARLVELDRGRPVGLSLEALGRAGWKEFFLIVDPHWFGLSAEEAAGELREFEVVEVRGFRSLTVYRVRARGS